MAVHAAESERLWLQSLGVEEHLQDYFEIMSSPESMFWSRGHPHTDPQQTLALMLESMPSPERPWNERWAILLRPTSEISFPNAKSMGTLEEKDIPKAKPKMIGIVGTPRKGELAYKIHPDYWGKGFMSETLSMFLKMFWDSKGNKDFNRLIAGADPENRASTRVLEKVGFRKSEYKKEFYERGINEGVKKSDLQFFFLERSSERTATSVV